MKNKQFQARQGDVLIDAVASIPSSATKKKDNVIAIGESMNHAHAVFGEVELLEDGNDIYITAKEEFELKHILMEAGVATEKWTDEHKEIKVPAGNYKVTLQNQFNPYKQAIERMAD